MSALPAVHGPEPEATRSSALIRMQTGSIANLPVGEMDGDLEDKSVDCFGGADLTRKEMPILKRRWKALASGPRTFCPQP